MQIIHVVDPFVGGLATFLKLLSEQLHEHTHVIIHGERKNLADAKDVRKIFPKNKIHFIHWKSAQRKINIFKDIAAYIELYKILLRFKNADVIHLHSSKAGFLGRLVCRQLKIKQVIYTPNGAPFLMNDAGRLKLKIYETLEKIAYRFGGRVVCASLSEQLEYKKRGIEAEFINNGTKVGKHSFIQSKDYSKFRIVTVGRVVDQKNPKYFNEIAKSFIDLSHFEFVWIGDGDDAELLNSPNIKLTGWLSKEGVKNEIAKADLYLSTSTFEGLSFAAMEAMSLGKCLLLSSCGGNIDLIKKGFNGQTFDSKEEAVNYIIYFYFNKEITYSMGLNALELCRDYFNIEETALRYHIKYLEVSQFSNKKINTGQLNSLEQILFNFRSRRQVKF